MKYLITIEIVTTHSIMLEVDEKTEKLAIAEAESQAKRADLKDEDETSRDIQIESIEEDESED